MGENRLGGGVAARRDRARGIERAGGRQAFDLAAVEQARVDPLGEIVEALERSIGRALGDQRFHRFFSDTLERAQG